jgi:phospholipid transport system substrate-binding protein
VNEEIPVDYSLTLVQEQWLMDDVTIDGVSIVRNYQRSFTRVIQRESYKSLLQKMRLQQQAIEKPS